MRLERWTKAWGAGLEALFILSRSDRIQFTFQKATLVAVQQMGCRGGKSRS